MRVSFGLAVLFLVVRLPLWRYASHSDPLLRGWDRLAIGEYRERAMRHESRCWEKEKL
jgi:hypothetical protein